MVDLVSQNRVNYPLLATRFFLPPLSPASIPRPRLMERLAQDLQVALVLVSAPPGFGKSSLIRQWIHDQENLKAGWLSLEPSDQDWELFFRYLTAAWQRIFPEVGQVALDALNGSPAMRRETLLDLLLNDILAAKERSGIDHALLVLDDYHRIDSLEIHETVIYIVEHLPPGCHIALLTRADPPLPVPRWRSRGQVLELRADDLRFTGAETAEYLNQSMHLALTGEQVHVLEDRTEGWIVGLQMAALALQGTRAFQGRKDFSSFIEDFGGSHRFVVDYLVDEVVRQQPDENQQFLMKTALFDAFCGPLCDALLGIPSPFSQQMLERLERANLFLIPLDDRRCWFRYHHLFADLLRVRQQQTYPEQITALYRRAAEWFAQNGMWRDAIQYALKTKDMDYSASLFEQAILKDGLDFLYSGIRSLLEPLPATMITQRPLLSFAKAVVIQESSQLAGIEPLLRFAEEGIRSAPPFPEQEQLLGLIYLIQAEVATQLGDRTWRIEAGQLVPGRISRNFVTHLETLVQFGFSAYYEGDLNQAESYWQQALDFSKANNKPYYILCMLNSVARLCCQKGELNRSDALFKQAFELLEEHPGQYLLWLGAMQRDYGDLLREYNRLDEALALIATAIPLLEKWHTISALGYGLYSKARVLLAFNDLAGANDALNQLDELRHRYTLFPDLETLAQVYRARYTLEKGDAEQAWHVLEDCLNSPCSLPVYPREWVLSSQARILVRTGRPAEALALLADCLESAKTGGRGRNWLTFCLLTALAHHNLEDMQQAFNFLGDSLVFAQAQGHRRAFLDEGEPMRGLLEVFRVQYPNSSFKDYMAEILSLFPARPVAGPGPLSRLDGLVESLSPRELEILQLVCQGLSNQEIARQLVLSVGTVKFHIHNTFGKLGVRDRPQAIAKARQLGLVNRVSPLAQ